MKKSFILPLFCAIAILLPSLQANYFRLSKEGTLMLYRKPFIIRGVCYSHVPQGGSFPQDLMTENPTPQNLKAIDHDFTLMEKAGVNTIRTYLPIFDKKILALIHKHHLHTIVPIFTPTRQADGSYSYDTTTEHAKAVVQRLARDPSTMIFEVGNEWNFNYLYRFDINDPQAKLDDINQKKDWMEDSLNTVAAAVKAIRSIDKNHFISTNLGENPQEPYIAESEKEDISPQTREALLALAQEQQQAILKLPVDFYGINVYDSRGLANRCQDWKAITNKPIYIAECGVDAWNMGAAPDAPRNNYHIGYAPDLQKLGIEMLLNDISKNLAMNNPSSSLLGCNIFEWCDEWWKVKDSDPNEHSTGGVYNPFFNPKRGPFPDQCFNEEYFGICEIDGTTRPAYDAISESYHSWEKLRKSN